MDGVYGPGFYIDEYDMRPADFAVPQSAQVPLLWNQMERIPGVEIGPRHGATRGGYRAGFQGRGGGGAIEVDTAGEEAGATRSFGKPELQSETFSEEPAP
jgi:hypothetical protein